MSGDSKWYNHPWIVNTGAPLFVTLVIWTVSANSESVKTFLFTPEAQLWGILPVILTALNIFLVGNMIRMTRLKTSDAKRDNTVTGALRSVPAPHLSGRQPTPVHISGAGEKRISPNDPSIKLNDKLVSAMQDAKNKLADTKITRTTGPEYFEYIDALWEIKDGEFQRQPICPVCMKDMEEVSSHKEHLYLCPDKHAHIDRVHIKSVNTEARLYQPHRTIRDEAHNAWTASQRKKQKGK